MLSLAEALFFSVVLVILIRSTRFIRSANPGPGLVSLTASIVYAVCLWVPARLQEMGIVESKLENARFLIPPSMDEISALSWRWSVELLVILLGEWIVWHLRFKRRLLPSRGMARKPFVIALNRERIAAILILVGACATIIFPAPALQDRATEGQGLATLLRTFLIVGLAYIVYNRGFGKFKWYLIAAIGVVVLASTNVRSPLLVVVFAFIAAEIANGKLRSFKRVFATITLVVLFALAGSFMSNWRENVTRYQGLEVSEVLASTLDEPWVQIYESGVDTLDGYRFSQQVAPVEDSRPQDLLNVVLTFVPRAIWEDKPSTISVDLSAKYLNYGASGQYLSPVGYLTIALGSYAAALIGMFAFSCLMSLAVRRYLDSFILTVVLCVTFRFLLGGSSFDLYYGITLLLPFLFAVLVDSVSRSSRTDEITPAGIGQHR